MSNEEMEIIACAIIAVGAIILYAIFDLWRINHGK
jgi:hypothetical protein